MGNDVGIHSPNSVTWAIGKNQKPSTHHGTEMTRGAFIRGACAPEAPVSPGRAQVAPASQAATTGAHHRSQTPQ